MESPEEEQEIEALMLVKQLARMTMYDPDDPLEGLDGEDAMLAMNQLIKQAREIVAIGAEPSGDAEQEQDDA